MKTTHNLFLALAVTAATLAAQTPTFTGVVNAGNQLPPGLPNSGIAQGALFDIYGTNLSAAPPSGQPYTEASLPLPTTTGLAGAVVTVTVSGTTVTAPILFALPTQVGAVMPSNTPTGTGTVTLTYNGKSASTAITVLQSGFGISNNYLQFANNGVGMGEQAAVTFVSNPTQAAIYTHTAAPGDQMIIWGTGLGATTTAGDSQGAPFGDIGTVPLIFVGGVQSPSVTYWGRSPGSVALDQINFTIPQGAPLGCNVSVVVQTTNGSTPVVSNAPTISIGATDGTTCSDPTQPFPISYLSRTSLKAFFLQIKQQTGLMVSGNGTPTTTVSTAGAAEFLQFNQAGLASSVSNLEAGDYQPSYGSCYTGFNSNPSANGTLGAATFLNAGTSITLAPPSGSPLLLTTQALGVYATGAAGTTALPTGTWSFSNGAGGSGVGPLTFTFPVPQQVVWSNETAVYTSQITRTTPLTITWTGGDANGYVDIQGSSHVGIYYVGFECAAPTSAGQFTIPSSILLSLPTGAAAQSGITVSTYALPSSLGTISGFDLALNGAQYETSVPVIFK